MRESPINRSQPAKLRDNMEPTNNTPTKQEVLDALLIHINQRTGMDAKNYISDWRDTEGRKAFAAEYREILREGRDARTLLGAIYRSPSVTVEDILAATKRAFSGRLTYHPETKRFSYCVGQYWPTEYRAAACAVLASVLWNWSEQPTADDKRTYFKREFGRGIQSRWFN